MTRQNFKKNQGEILEIKIIIFEIEKKDLNQQVFCFDNLIES